ncbi:TIGR02452 family protein [Streptacidiphilus cavernicola]|uniref:TIGR02452 family protein n=1 Tax=Streptacidiphilus cavernicola TaxID=3342716 RepID=A0ABV6W0R1_9ACTN
MSSRLHTIATENERIAAEGHYWAADGSRVTIEAALKAAATGTRCHQPEEALSRPSGRSPGAAPAGPSGPGGPADGPADRALRIEVTAEKTLDAARRLCDSGAGEVAVLNFASARNPGGGYLRGAKAQEEDLCREALLYSCLIRTQHDYYEPHRASDDLLYSDRVIWSPQVPVHRGNGALLPEPYLVSFLTSPAPNAGQMLRRDPAAGPAIDTALRRRAGRVLAVAAAHGVRRLVLGAWGCGVFANQPTAVAEAFHQHLEGDELGNRRDFDEIVFAVWDRGTHSANRDAFTHRFAG